SRQPSLRRGRPKKSAQRESLMWKRRDSAGILAAAAAVTTLCAMGLSASPLRADKTHPWLIPELAAAAKAEGALTVYGSMNEGEALPLWKLFEDATGVKVAYVRSSDTQIMAKVAIENRARQRTWDIAFTTTVGRIPPDYLVQFDPPEAKNLM